LNWNLRALQFLSVGVKTALLYPQFGFWENIEIDNESPKRRGFTSMYIKKKKRGRVSVGFTRVARVPGRPTGSTGFRRANSPAGFYLDPDRSQARVDPPGRSGFQNSALDNNQTLLNILNSNTKIIINP
jgi:hypothetical protein